MAASSSPLCTTEHLALAWQPGSGSSNTIISHSGVSLRPCWETQQLLLYMSSGCKQENPNLTLIVIAGEGFFKKNNGSSCVIDVATEHAQ